MNLRTTTILIVAWCATHEVLLRTMADSQVVARLFASGGAIDHVLLAITFLAVRLSWFIVAPGAITYVSCVALHRILVAQRPIGA